MKECITSLYMVTLVKNGGIEYRYFYTRTRAKRFTDEYGGFYQKVHAVSPDPLYYVDTKTGLTMNQLSGGEPETVEIRSPYIG